MTLAAMVAATVALMVVATVVATKVATVGGSGYGCFVVMIFCD